MEGFAEPGKVIKEVGVVSVDMSGDDVAMVFPGFGDEGLFPVEVHDFAAFDLAGAEAEGEVADGAVAGEGLVEKAEVLGTVGHAFARLVHGNEDGLQVFDEQQEVVDGGDHLGVVVADGADEGDAVEAAEGVVGGHDGAVSHGEVFLAMGDHVEVEVVDHGMDEIHPLQCAILAQDGVDILLMKESLDASEQPVVHPLHELRGLGLEYLPEIDQVTVKVFHVRPSIDLDVQK